MTTFADVFTEEQMAHILDLWQEHHQDYDTLQKKLADYLQPFAAELEAKGMHWKYASYGLPIWLKEAVKQKLEEQ